MSTTIQDVFSPGKNATPLNRRKVFSAMLFQGNVSQKVVNRKLGRTTVFTIYDRFTKFTDFRYTTFFDRKLPTGSEQS